VSDSGRRAFLGTAAAAIAGVALAPGVRLIEFAGARAPGQAASARVRWGMLIDTAKCATGCDACVRACNEEHGLRGTGRPRTDAQWIRKIDLRDLKNGRQHSAPVMCQHCAEPPCVDVCPTGASFKRADGIVLVDKHTCIGCRYCVMACPYKARSFIHENLVEQKPEAPRGKGTVESCTLCVHKVDRGDGTTACAEACKAAGHEAIVFGDLNDPKGALAKRLRELPSRQLRADLRLDTAIRYSGV
jgi:molybdopterin-containing oxidoreductase family iron-sulfur binding subunit